MSISTTSASFWGLGACHSVKVGRAATHRGQTTNLMSVIEAKHHQGKRQSTATAVDISPNKQ
eukprot:scaffold1072_cov125-Skeletonema_dohrnii-CCMP3373.AAC.3